MAVVTTNLGVITAYGDAVAAGYTGTKAEWQALMASYATVAQEAQDSADDAAQSATDANTAKIDAETAKQGAINAKNDAETAKADAENARDDAQDIVDGINAKSAQIDENTDEIEALKNTLSALGLSVVDGAINITYEEVSA